jgi:conjugative relaxase-like TrwC/TraI family protein
MLRINSLKSASDYYTKSLTKGDYYSEQAEISGVWQGLGAKKLGLFGEIKKEQFDLMCAGHHPLTREQLSSRIIADRREAYDFTFSVPKSVSVLSAVSSPEVASLIQDQIKESMKFTMTEVEKNIQTRIRESGKNDNRVTGNIVYGHFLHKNSRPIDGYSDPQLHIHAVVMNLTFDGVEKKWKAVQMRDKKENASYYQSIFNSTLANRFQNLGLTVRKTPENFDLAGITDQTIKTFSRRTDEIEKEAKVQNIHNPDAKGKLGARTRQSKSDNHSQSELQEIYNGLINPEQKIVLEGLNTKLQNKIENNEIDYKLLNQNLLSQNPASQSNIQNLNQTYPQDQTKKWLDYTLEHHFERHSTSSEHRLIGEVLKNGIGQTSLDLVTKQIEQYKKDGVLIDELFSDKVDLESIKARNNLSPSITTQVAVGEEKSINKLINSRVNTYNPVNLQYSQTILKDTFLNTNQKKVVSELMLSLDGVDLLEGKAGTGKTTTLKAVEIGLSQAGYSVTVLAPTIKAVEVLQAEGFTDSMTVQKYLNNPEDGELRIKSKNYLIIDEASLVSVRQMNKLLTIASDSKYRVILVGDTKQHKSVERGNTLKTIQEHSNIETYSLNQIQRQTQNEAKLAVEDLSKGKVLEGIEKFQKLGFVKEIEDDTTRLETLANLYLKHLPQVYTNKIQKQEIQVEIENTNQPRKTFLDRIKTNDFKDIFGNQKQYETQTKFSSEKIDYQKLTPQSPTLVITPTHKDGDQIHSAIRAKLKDNNLIGQDDHTIQTVRSLTWTTAQKSEISNYQEGQILQFNSNILGFKKGEKWEVIGNQKKESEQNIELTGIKKENTQGLELSSVNNNSEKTTNYLQNNNFNDKYILNKTTGEIKSIPTDKPSYFEVFKPQELTVSKNDLIQIQKQSIVQDHKGINHQLTNGATYQIKSISPKTGDLTLSNDWIIPKDFGNIKSAYYSTSQASQGQTVNHSIFYTSKASLPLLNQEMVYVANSRFKQSNMILTPDLVEFKQHAQKGEMKLPALSVVELKTEKSKEIPKPELKPDIDLVIQKPELAKSKELFVAVSKKKMKR